MDNKVLDLLEIRDQIDGIDKEIVELFEKRMQLSAEVAEYKISNNKMCIRDRWKGRCTSGADRKTVI